MPAATRVRTTAERPKAGQPRAGPTRAERSRREPPALRQVVDLLADADLGELLLLRRRELLVVVLGLRRVAARARFHERELDDVRIAFALERHLEPRQR